MPRVSATEAKKSFSNFLNRAAYGTERIFVASHHKPKAAAISVKDLRWLERLEHVAVSMEAGAELEAGEAPE